MTWLCFGWGELWSEETCQFGLVWMGGGKCGCGVKEKGKRCLSLP